MKHDFYKAYSVLNSAKQYTGNDEFDKIAAILKDSERLLSLASDVLSEFPTRDDDHYYNSRPQSLKQKVTDRLQKTDALLKHVREMKSQPKGEQQS